MHLEPRHDALAVEEVPARERRHLLALGQVVDADDAARAALGTKHLVIHLPDFEGVDGRLRGGWSALRRLRLLPEATEDPLKVLVRVRCVAAHGRDRGEHAQEGQNGRGKDNLGVLPIWLWDALDGDVGEGREEATHIGEWRHVGVGVGWCTTASVGMGVLGSGRWWRGDWGLGSRRGAVGTRRRRSGGRLLRRGLLRHEEIEGKEVEGR